MNTTPVLAAPPRLDELELLEAESCGLTFWRVRGDFTGHHLEAGVTYEDNVLRALLRDAANARTVIDVGCNIGLIALPVARTMAPNGTVYCLDISQRNCRLLLANAKRNGLSNVVVYPTGAGDALASFPIAIRPSTTLQLLCVKSDDFLSPTEIAFTAPLDALFASGQRSISSRSTRTAMSFRC